MISKLNDFTGCDDILDSILYLKDSISKKSQKDEYDRIYKEHFALYPDPRKQNYQRIVRGLENILHRFVFIVYFRYMLFNVNRIEFKKLTQLAMLKLLDVHDFSIMTFLVSGSFLIYAIDESIKITVTNFENASKYTTVMFNEAAPFKEDEFDEMLLNLIEKEKNIRKWCLEGEGEFFELNRKRNILSDEELEQLALESITNEYIFDGATVVNGKSFYRKFKGINYNLEICTNINIGVYIFIGTTSVNLSYDSISDLLIGNKEMVRIPVSFKLVHSKGGPHNGVHNIFSFYDHDVGHLFDIVKNFRLYDLSSIHDGLAVINEDPKSFERRLITIFVWLYLFEYRTCIGKTSRNVEILKYIKQYLPDFNIFSFQDKYNMLNLELDFFENFREAVNVTMLEESDRIYMIRYLAESSDLKKSIKDRYNFGENKQQFLQKMIEDMM